MMIRPHVGLKQSEAETNLKAPPPPPPPSACCPTSLDPSDPSMDLSQVTIVQPAPAAAAAGTQEGGGDNKGQAGKYEPSANTLYIGGLPVEWNTEQVIDSGVSIGGKHPFTFTFTLTRHCQ